MWLTSTIAISPLRTNKELSIRNKACTTHAPRHVPHGPRSCQKREFAVTQTNLRLVEGTAIGKTTALGAIVSKMDRKGSIMRLRTNKSAGLGVLEAIEPDAELFALAEQVDLAEKAFHDAVARRNEAQIAYFREPSIITQVAFECNRGKFPGGGGVRV